MRKNTTYVHCHTERWSLFASLWWELDAEQQQSYSELLSRLLASLPKLKSFWTMAHYLDVVQVLLTAVLSLFGWNGSIKPSGAPWFWLLVFHQGWNATDLAESRLVDLGR